MKQKTFFSHSWEYGFECAEGGGGKGVFRSCDVESSVCYCHPP